MSGLEAGWYVFIAFCCLFALADWRRAVYLGIAVDVLRDPVRKLIPDQPVFITLSGATMWLVIVAMASLSQKRTIKQLFRLYPKLRTAVQLGLVALIPAAILSTINFHRGWLMATIGAASYVVPAIGIVAGFAFLRHVKDVRRMMIFYICVNSLMLISVPIEYAEIDIPALGGINYNWIRYHEDRTVELICGWYRSPDVMGLHAAQCVMFSLLLIILSKGEKGAIWAPLALWAAFSVFLSGRRKMIGIPLVFVGTFLALGLLLKLTKLNRLTGTLAVTASLGLAVVVIIWSPDQAQDHSDFAATLVTQGVFRGQEIIFGSLQGTLTQAGVLGAGLGTATQGRYYAGVQSSRALRGWQEDGVSRLLLEFGVPGVIFLIIAISLLVRSLKKAVACIPRTSSIALLQVGLVCIVAGNAASFAISHQQFSGDPVNGVMVTLFIGMIFKVPTLTNPTQQFETAVPTNKVANTLA